MRQPENIEPKDAIERSLEVSPLAQLVIGRDGVVRAASPPARELLGIPSPAAGIPLAALVTVESADQLLGDVDRACASGEPVAFADQPWIPLHGEPRRLSGGIMPVSVDGADVAVAVTVAPTPSMGLQNHNDELKRDNSELRSIADELRTRTDELNVVAVFLQSVLTSLRGAVVVIDTTQAIRVWNAEAERLWGIPRRVAMRSRLPDLDLCFEQSLLAEAIEAGLRAEVHDELILPVACPGREVTTHTVSVTPLLGPGVSVHGATLLFVERRASVQLPN